MDIRMEVVSNDDDTSDDEGDQEAVSKLSTQARKMSIEDHDIVDDWDQLLNSFSEHYKPLTISSFARQKANSGSGGTGPVCVVSDSNCDETVVLCGFIDGTCKAINVNELSDDVILFNGKTDWKHVGLSCIRSSRVSPFLFYTSSTADSVIRQWDRREPARKPSQKFSLEQSSEGGSGKSQKKPILNFDISCGDQLLCAGTEKVEEDSYLLFWDTRSTKLLGAYWESHSDDVTAVKFHHSQVHSLASGSTDGLLNVFNLLEPEEDDALLYSFNTNSSVDSICWNAQPNDSKVTCVTHTNEVQIWDSSTGDPVKEVNRDSLAKTMKRSNPDAVHISSCHHLPDTSHVGLMTCSLSGGNTRLIELNDDMEPVPRGLFLDQTAVVQTSVLLSKSRQWITFDENGVMKFWKAIEREGTQKKRKTKKSSEERRSKKRFKPYKRGDQ